MTTPKVTYYVIMAGNTVDAVITEFQARNSTGWVEVQSATPITVGMTKQSNGTFKGANIDPWDGVYRMKRNALLNDCDWTQIPDVVPSGRLTQAQQDAWKAYRQALANLPETYPDPTTAVYPDKPE